MTPQEFIDRYCEYFGERAPLPLAVVYSDSPLREERNVPGCMFKQFHRAYSGEIITLSADNLTCGGGGEIQAAFHFRQELDRSD